MDGIANIGDHFPTNPVTRAYQGARMPGGSLAGSTNPLRRADCENRDTSTDRGRSLLPQFAPETLAIFENRVSTAQ